MFGPVLRSRSSHSSVDFPVHRDFPPLSSPSHALPRSPSMAGYVQIPVSPSSSSFPLPPDTPSTTGAERFDLDGEAAEGRAPEKVEETSRYDSVSLLPLPSLSTQLLSDLVGFRWNRDFSPNSPYTTSTSSESRPTRYDRRPFPLRPLFHLHRSHLTRAPTDFRRPSTSLRYERQIHLRLVQRRRSSGVAEDCGHSGGRPQSISPFRNEARDGGVARVRVELGVWRAGEREEVRSAGGIHAGKGL